MTVLQGCIKNGLKPIRSVSLTLAKKRAALEQHTARTLPTGVLPQRLVCKLYERLCADLSLAYLGRGSLQCFDIA